MHIDAKNARGENKLTLGETTTHSRGYFSLTA